MLYEEIWSIIMCNAMKKFESLDSPKFNKLEVESMKRLKGGYTLNTVTVYSSGNVNDDGNACQDGVCND